MRFSPDITAHSAFAARGTCLALQGVVMRSARGFTILEVLIVIAIATVLAGVGLGVTTTVVRMSRGEPAAQQLDAFLKRYREVAVARRRDIEIRFLAPNQVQSLQRAIPDPPAATPAPTVLETMTFEGYVGYRIFSGVPDTPNLFGNLAPVALGGVTPVMFSSEGAFVDVGGNPVNATLSLGIEDDQLSATAVTILGATATIERWRWNGTSWGK
jgi:prepilin-type N-terminal cleavage/methylation domain-containing protein